MSRFNGGVLPRTAVVLCMAGIVAGCVQSRSAPPAIVPENHSIRVTEFGAVGDGRTLNTKSIQAAIDHLATTGGALRIPRGVFLSGAIFLKPGVSLCLEQGAVLKGSTDIADYPKISTRIEGHSEPFLTALVNADGVDHLSITGPGMLDGSGRPFWAAFWQRRRENPNCTNLEVLRPRLVFIQNCRGVSISNLELKDSGFWNLHLYRCQDAVLDSLNIHVALEGVGKGAPSSDGMDIDSCQRVAVTNCTFAVHDDCIALKGTKGPFALDDKLSQPVEQIHISACTFNAGYAALTCGSEATEVRDVIMEHCTVVGPMPLLHLKLRPDTPQSYHDIRVSDITMNSGTLFDVSPWKQFFDLKGQPAPQSSVKDVAISGVSGSFESFGRIVGNPGTVISNISLENVDVQLASEEFQHQAIDGLKVSNVQVNGTEFVAK